MSAVTVYPDNDPQQGQCFTDFESIKSQLSGIGVQFERWTALTELTANADQTEILAAYSDSISRLKAEYGFQSVDVISLSHDHPEKAAFRQKFLSEHIHEDFEVRFFIAGQGLFYLHVGDKVFAVLCEQGDLISVPANTTHWFDMGEKPNFKCIRLFTTPEGWVAKFTNSTIAESFPTLDQYVAELS